MTLPHQVEPRTLWRVFWFALLACAVGGALAPGQATGVRLLMPVIVCCQAGIGFLIFFLVLRIGAITGVEWFHNGFRWMCLFCFYMILFCAAVLLLLGPWLASEPDYQIDGLVWPHLVIGIPSALGGAFGAFRVFDTECF